MTILSMKRKSSGVTFCTAPLRFVLTTKIHPLMSSPAPPWKVRMSSLGSSNGWLRSLSVYGFKKRYESAYMIRLEYCKFMRSWDATAHWISIDVHDERFEVVHQCLTRNSCVDVQPEGDVEGANDQPTWSFDRDGNDVYLRAPCPEISASQHRCSVHLYSL